jgi:hypothetical protein
VVDVQRATGATIADQKARAKAAMPTVSPRRAAVSVGAANSAKPMYRSAPKKAVTPINATAILRYARSCPFR